MPSKPQHQAVLAPEAAPTSRPETGPIALLPAAVEPFLSEVADAGGVVAPLGPETRGLVWLEYAGADTLDAVLREHPQIGWVQLPWAGVDAFANVIAAHPERLWTSAKGAYAQPVAEHALMLTLALLRLLPKRLAAKRWIAREDGRSLFGLNVTIIGAGGIARELIRLLEPFGCQLTIVRRRAGEVPGAAVCTDLHAGLAAADVVVLAAASTAESYHLLGPAEFAAMRHDAIVVNVARGALIDTDALVQALQSGQIAGAGVDVTEPEPLPEGHPLWSCPNTIVTPHVADTDEMVEPLLAERIRHNVAAFTGTTPFIGIVSAELGY